MAKLRAVEWQWLAIAGALAVPWLFVWSWAPSTGLVYVGDALVSIALAFGVFWLYRRVADVVFLRRHDLGAALGRVVTASFFVVLASYLFVQAAYTFKINGSPGPQESQALWAGAFLISAAGIYRVLDGANRPERSGDNV
ncbi:MAG: hypothetical protein HKN91_08055 [Acidimicrobiia bacterium]|nr:hypothetical protein [Acidimicrobiia bacterium]